KSRAVSSNHGSSESRGGGFSKNTGFPATSAAADGDAVGGSVSGEKVEVVGSTSLASIRLTGMQRNAGLEAFGTGGTEPMSETLGDETFRGIIRRVIQSEAMSSAHSSN
ncbi:unnamed protein product, partial [Protopolystoma xenopodis]